MNKVLIGLILGILIGGTGVYYKDDIYKALNKNKPVAEESKTEEIKTTPGEKISICSFNIKFLGFYKDKKNDRLAEVVKDYDIVVIQELVAAPYPGKYPNGAPYVVSPKATAFFDAMKKRGFSYILSPEDTGKGETIHKGSSATEWFVTFYKPNKVKPAKDLPNGFLADDRSNNPDYDRVPYAFAFRTTEGKTDFVLISVHLRPSAGTENTRRRAHELGSIMEWIQKNNMKEKDFIILGDMNIESKKEFDSYKFDGMAFLNSEFKTTNCTPKKPEAFDHVIYDVKSTREIIKNFKVINLIDATEKMAQPGEIFSGRPYDGRRYPVEYSDHHPVVFEMMVLDDDD